jgi:hypothetical protein
MGVAGYVTVCVQLYCVIFHCLSLHVLAYMAIFKCVGYFHFHMPEGFCFAAFFQVVTLCTFPFVFFLCCFSSLILLFLACVFVCFFFLPLPLGERAPDTHCIGGWMGSKTGLDDVERRKFFAFPGHELQPFGRPARSQLLYRLLSVIASCVQAGPVNAVSTSQGFQCT